MTTATAPQRRVAAVFSASRPPGLGLEVARRLIAAGLDVVCVDHARLGGDESSTHVGKKEWLDALVAEFADQPGRLRVIDADMTREGEIDRAAARVIETAGRLDVAMIMNGATGPASGSIPFTQVDEAGAYRSVQLNLIVPFLIARACANAMIRQGKGGAIVLQSSSSGVFPSPRNGLFGASRAGLNFMVRSFAQELGPHGIRVNSVNPLAIVPEGDLSANPGLERMVAASGKDAAQKFAELIPLGRPQARAETASVMVFLALEASFVTGEAWTVAGGATRD